MSQFYNRYIPTTSKPNKEDTTVAKTEKRKRDEQKSEGAAKEIKQKRQKTETLENSRQENGHIQSKGQRVESLNGTEQGKSILEKYSISRFAKSQDNSVDVTVRKKHRKKDSRDGDSQHNHLDNSGADGKLNGNTSGGEDANKKHSGVLRKYSKSKKQSETSDLRSQEQADAIAEENQSATEIRGLVPLPQPEAPHIEPSLPTYSTVPAWQATPTNVKPQTSIGFQDIGLSDEILSNLKERGIQNTFPVQSTVIPLLIEGESLHPGDICVSAATGSGKTLAYVVPVIQSLIKAKNSGLRAVIVVPTRELVKQVRETCEICASGTTLQIATAVGSKSLLKEQKILVEEQEIYDPEAYEAQQRAPVDWRSFDLEKVLERTRLPNSHGKKDHVTQSKIKANILITTPGRLVDHLQNTAGFHLDDVRWLVVDEADRLLNESYQDWIDVVVPALQSRKATEQRDKILTHMRMDLPPRIVKKVLLSATMTSDISKLNSIGLNNPKLVVLDTHQDEVHGMSDADADNDIQHHVGEPSNGFSLPGSLHEAAVTIKDGADKPLLLLHLLQSYVKILEFGQTTHTKDDTSSDSDSDTSSGSDTSSSDNDLDDESDSTSSSESSSTSSDSLASSSSTSSRGPKRRERKGDFPLPKRQVAAATYTSTHASSHARVLVFARSTAAASRLSRLLSIIHPTIASQIVTLTRSTAASASSRKALASFRSGKTPILIATDRASRGIDVPGLMHVISYDIPGSALTYIHRVGRTARAGKEGTAWTIVEHREGKWFWNEIGGKSGHCMIQRNQKVKKMDLKIPDDEDMRKRYEDALQILGSEVRGE